MSVKLKQSNTSTTTDFSEFQPRKFQAKNQNQDDTEFFPPNDFAQPSSKESNITSKFPNQSQSNQSQWKPQPPQYQQDYTPMRSYQKSAYPQEQYSRLEKQPLDLLQRQEYPQRQDRYPSRQEYPTQDYALTRQDYPPSRQDYQPPSRQDYQPPSRLDYPPTRQDYPPIRQDYPLPPPLPNYYDHQPSDYKRNFPQNNQFQNQQQDYYQYQDFQQPPPSQLPSMFMYDSDFLPQEVLFLLAEEENLIVKFRQKVEVEKKKVENDMEIIKTEFINLVDDLKTQVTNYIDDHYKRYINVFGAFKDEVLLFKQQKLEAPVFYTPPPQQDLAGCSNTNLLRELEELRYKNQMTKINQYVCQLTKTRLEKISEISKDLLHLTSSNSNLYNTEKCTKQLNQLKQEISSQLISRFSNMIEYVQPLDYLLPPKGPDCLKTLESPQMQNQTQMFNKTIEMNPYLLKEQIPQQQYPQPPQMGSPPPCYSRPQPMLDKTIAQYPIGQSNNQTPTPPPQKSAKQGTYSLPPICHQNSQQQNCNQIRSNKQFSSLELKSIGSYKTRHSEMVLCFVVIKNDMFATGSKDGTIKIWEKDKEIICLEGHRGSICTLSVLKQSGVSISLVSGSDNGDNSIKIWNLQTFKESNRLEGHQAAVVALLTLDDGQTVISGSYDKKIMVWNVEQDRLMKELKLHENGVSSLVYGNDKLVSGGLDGIIGVWNSQYVLERQIQNMSIVCSLNMIRVDNKYVILSGGKDGKIRLYDSQNGNCEKNITANMAGIVEMIVVKNEEDLNVLSMCNKDKNLVLTNTMNGDNELIDVNEQVEIEYGCGVYPKMQIVNNKECLIVNQENQQIDRYEIILI